MDAWWLEVWQTLQAEFADIGDAKQLTQITVRLLIAAILGGILGFERESKGKAAGVRTHMLVAAGSAVVVAVGDLLVRGDGGTGDPSRVIHGVITGIGFLGAGVMMTRDGQVLGVTSAATIWMLAALGALIGMGMLHQAVLLTGVTLGILVGVHYLETSFKSLRRGVHNRLEHWRNGNERGAPASPRQEELGSGLEK